MAERRDFMGYIGTGAIGGIVGYYVGAQKLLGIQSETPRPETETSRPETETSRPETETPRPETENQTPTQSGQGTLFDDFEDQELGWEIRRGDRDDLSFSDDSVEGESSLYFENTDTTTLVRKSLPSNRQIESFSFWFKYNSQYDNQWRFGVFNQNGDPAVQFWNYFSDINISYQSGDETIADIEQNQWFQVIASDIDYQSNTTSAEVRDTSGNVVDSSIGLDFKYNSETIQFFQVRDNLDSNGGADPLWIDHIRYER